MELTVVPFSTEYVEEAARLLAARHAQHRRAEPLLPERFEAPAAAREQIAVAWSAEGASGAAAEEPEVVRELYAAAAAAWFTHGRRRHYVLVPATDQLLVDAWFRLGFGHQQAHGVREVTAPANSTRTPEGLEIRRPREEDIERSIP